MVPDPVADMLTRIRNALIARHDFTDIRVFCKHSAVEWSADARVLEIVLSVHLLLGQLVQLRLECFQFLLGLSQVCPSPIEA